MQMQNQGKAIQRLKQSNKDLMAVIWKTKRERAKKGREVCKVNNEVVQYKKRIAELEEQLHDLPKKIMGDIEKNFTEYLPREKYLEWCLKNRKTPNKEEFERRNKK